MTAGNVYAGFTVSACLDTEKENYNWHVETNAPAGIRKCVNCITAIRVPHTKTEGDGDKYQAS